MALDLPLDGADPALTLQHYRWLAGDPTVRLAHRRIERATLTPEGPVSYLITWGEERVETEAWCDGAAWMLDRMPLVLGLHDDHLGFDPSPDHRLVRDLWRRTPGLRIGASGTVWHDLAWLIPQQRVTTQSASRSWREMVAALGEPAPGPLDLLLPPRPEVVAGTSSSTFHSFGLERQRSDTLVRAARSARLWNRVPLDDPAEARRLIESVRGLGRWTSTSATAFTFGDADAVVLRDYNHPNLVAFSLAREERADDDRMVELLEPFRPHRFRVLRLLQHAGVMPPRRGPRRFNPDIRRL